ncbi:diacylglycerol kinase [Bacillus canaveralius]|uniref:Diacylglycerol kinase n=1 Tax=Bacillus canaveralius TaxID=1403243 RepID=A0A2N5GK54_9BACI|nr:YegS/Rv2252/BmrU family lipid kinase [Bacillus canaveralius]PLR81776.1 diacylglycerol kinase [Bacillus canaveralius]PLR96722.1 diacylglycerol kinase [Bacillus canaveralius]RSK49193.1 YegS/Rv2252/BmrU family lipid kinase [Bacillus canaveralius]
MNTVHKQALMVYNAFSGKKATHKDFPLLIQRLTEMGYRITIQQPAEFEDVVKAIKNACQSRWDAIFIAGGDGTVNQTIQLLAEEEYRPTVGVFPFGTSNELAKYLGMSCPMEALSIIERGNTKQVDIGKFGNRYFANIAAAGWLSDITYRTPPTFKSYFGEWAYCYYFLKTFFLTKQSDAISVDVSSDQVISDICLFLIMNGNSVGPFEHLIKNSTENDGYFHLITCKKTNRLQLLVSLLAKMLNIPDNSSVINHTKIKSGCFTIPECIALNLDGEKAYVKSLHFKVLPQHLRVFCSTDK